MFDLMLVMTSKTVVVSLAILGAILTTFARSFSNLLVVLCPGRRVQSRDSATKRISKGFITIGYVAMSLSIFLFIVSGFIIDLF